MLKKSLNIAGKIFMAIVAIGFISAIWQQKAKLDRNHSRPGEIKLLNGTTLSCSRGVPFPDNAGVIRPIPSSEEVDDIGLFCLQLNGQVFVKYNDISEIKLY